MVCPSPGPNMTPRTSNDMTRLLLFASVSPSQRCCLLNDLDDLYSLCSVRKILAARSPITTHGAIVLPVVTRGMMAASAILRPAISYTATVLRLPSHHSPSTTEDGGGIANPGCNGDIQHGSEPPRS